MAIQLMQENGEYNIKSQHFLIDEENDLVNLESEYSCSMGDRAELPDGTIYVRHSDEYQGDLWELNENASIEKVLPPINFNDEGKFLGVVNNNWNIVDRPKELPNIETNDVGKILMAQSMPTGGTVIVPFQMVEIENTNQGVALIDIEDSYIEERIDCFIEVDENEYSATIDSELYLTWDEGSSIDFNTGDIYFNSTGEHFIKVSLLSEKYDWEKVEIPTELPEVDSSDNGKILSVIDGYWNVGEKISYGEEEYKTILDTASYTTAEDNGYYKCDNVCSLANLIDGDIIKVTFDGDEYEVEAKVSRYGKAIGDNVNNFTNYPFYINTGTFPGNATLYTEEAGTYSIKIERKIVTPSKEFSDAALASIKYIKFMTTQLLGGTQITCNYSRDEVWAVFEDEAPVIASIDGVLCAQGMKYLYPNMIQFRVLDFTSDNNTPVLKERIISVNEYNTPEFSYSENLYELTAHN